MDVAAAKDLGRIVEHAPSLIYVYDQVRHQNAYANRSIGEMLGYTAAELAQMGADIMPKIIHPDDLGRVFDHFSHIRRLDDNDVATLEYRVRHSEGHWVWMLSHDTVFRRDGEERVTHHIGAASDVTAQKQAEAEALAAQAKESVTNEELKEFAYSISHDMKAPANTIKLILLELDKELGSIDGTEPQQLLSLAHTTADRMLQLVEEVLDYTQIIGQEASFERVDLTALFAELVIGLETEIPSRKATVNIDPLPSVKGSETQLKILFRNLLHNAVKFSRPCVEPVVHVTAKPGKSPESIAIAVEDNGIGIPEERFDQIFKIFKKLSSDSLHEGTGLGLAACRRIALNHQSSISLSSVENEGSTFAIELEKA